jgi:hypothetical protein
MQIVMISVDSDGEEANADLVLRRTKSIRPEEKNDEQKRPKPGPRPYEPIPQ